MTYYPAWEIEQIRKDLVAEQAEQPKGWASFDAYAAWLRKKMGWNKEAYDGLEKKRGVV